MSMPVESLVLIAVAIINALFAGIIVVRNTRSRIHILFSITMVCNAFWALGVAMMIGSSSLEMGLSWSRMFVIAPMFTAFFLMHLVYSFPEGRKTPTKYTIFFGAPLAVLATVYFLDSNILISDFYRGESFNEFTVNKLAYFLYSMFFVVYFSVSYSVLFVKARRAKGVYRTQLAYVLAGVFLSSSLALLTNLMLPYFGNSKYVWLGPVFTLLYVSAFTYSIAKHQLFDIRAAIARSVAYALSLGTMLAIYVALIFTSTGLFLDNSAVSNTQKLIYAIFAVLIAFTFQPLKNFFDKFTDDIFYRSKYDPEQLISDYSDFLVDEIDTDSVIKETLSLMDEVANPTNALVVLYREGVAIWHDRNGPIYADDKEELAKALEYQSASVFVADKTRIHEDPFTENLKSQMLDARLEISVRLSTHGQLEGFIVLGDKKSGTRYTQKDLSFFVTVANELSVTIQNSQRFDQIQHFNVTLQHEVEEATARLKQTNEKLKQLDTAKDEFISMASHQLRTPLTSVKGYLSMVMDGDAGEINQDQEKLLSEAFASSQRMVYLIADLLNVSRLKTGKFIIEPNKVNLATIVQEEVDQLTPTAMTRQVQLNYSPPGNFPILLLDETKTRQVVMNFIDNAIYYTKSGGDIFISLVAKKDRIEYRVKDSGIGIPAAEQHKLFTKFFRASNAKRARPDGTGLGLYMAQKVIAAQEGSITFKSVEGKGSTFGFNIPLNEKTIPKDN